MKYHNILVEKESFNAIITIHRPDKLNALNKETIAELSNALDELAADKSVRVLIITGSGQKSFVAGADISEFAHFTKEQGIELSRNGQVTLFDKIENFEKPVIAAINGFALGGGLELAMACHVRIASENARLGLPEVSLGVIPGYGGTQRLSHLVGKGKAVEMICSAEMIKADEALSWGLVNKVVALDQIMNEAKAMADKFSKNSPIAIKSALKSINAAYKYDINGYEVEIELFGESFGTKDFKEGTTAFLEKRKADFKGE